MRRRQLLDLQSEAAGDGAIFRGDVDEQGGIAETASDDGHLLGIEQVLVDAEETRRVAQAAERVFQAR